MIAVDTNILVYAHRVEMADNRLARAAIDQLMAVERSWAVPWPCVHEFLSTVTRKSGFANPTPMTEAVATISDLEMSGRVRFLYETAGHLDLLAGLLDRSSAVGPRVHDARIAAICLGHGVDELWTADRDFSRFPDLRTRNPLIVKYKQS